MDSAAAPILPWPTGGSGEVQKVQEDRAEVSIQSGIGSEKDLGKQERVAPAAASWADVAKEKKVMKKYELEIMNLEGKSVVEIPDEVVKNANHLWDDFLIGRFLDTAPHIARVHSIVNKIWSQGEKIEVYEVDTTTMKFRVSDSNMRARILRRGMWNIGNVPLVVTQWIPEELEEKPEVKSIPLWVHLKNVPMHMFSWEGLSFITSAVGFPVRLHPETASCSNFKVAKVFVNADLAKDFPKEINFTKVGKSFLVEFSYPRMPLRCHTCGKWGHIEKVCIMNKKDGTTKSVKEIIAEGYRGNTEVSKQVVEAPEHTVEISKQIVEGSVETEKVPTEEPQKQIMEVSKEVEDASKPTLEIPELEGMESQQTGRVQAQTGKAVEVENNMKVTT